MYGIELPRYLTPQLLYLRVYDVQLRLIGASLQELPNLFGRLIHVLA